MKHRHKLSDGGYTGLDIPDYENPTKHYHMLLGDRTSIEDDNETHSHTVNGQITYGPEEYTDKGIDMNIETKRHGGRLIECKQETIAGINVGIIEGYIATWDVDRGDWTGLKDQFVRGAFLDSIQEHRSKNRQIRFKDHHGRTIGGWPIEHVKEDEVGLWGRAEVNLDVQQGREAYSLAKQGVLTDFSIGFSPIDFTTDDDLRTITKATIWEGSIVDEPMNPKANVTDVKSVTPFRDLPLADRDREWDADAAIGRMRDFSDSTDEPSADYKYGFLWYDKEDTENFGGYKLPYADVVNGRLVAVPKAIFAAAAAMQGARGGVNIPTSDRTGVIRHIERYYAKMDMPSPFDDDDKQYFIAEEVEKMTERQIEKLLKKTGMFSKSAAITLSSRLSPAKKIDESEEVNNTMREILDNLTSMKTKLST